MDVSVVITCWNGRKLLEKNLPAVLRAAENPKNDIVEIIVVDDGSTDGSTDFVRKFQIPIRQQADKFQIKTVVHDKNYGYSKTCNTGVREARGELVTILNLDVIPDIDFLVSALPHFEDEKIFSVSFNEGKFGPGKLVWENGFLSIAPSNIPKETAITGWPSGGSSIFRKRVWEKIGGMKEIYSPFYFEDIDLGIRAYKAGYKCLFEPKTKVVHEHEGTINETNFKKRYIETIKQRNRLILTWKNIDSSSLFLSHLSGLLKMSISRPGYLKIIVKALRRVGVIPLFFGKESKNGDLLRTEEVLRLNEKIS